MSKTFDLMSFIEETDYPTLDVTIYRSIAAMNEFSRLDAELNDTGDQNRARIIEAEMEKVRKRIEESGITFTLQGRSFEDAKAIADIFSDDGATEEQILELIAQSITAVTDADGASASVPTAEQLKTIHGKVSPAEFNKLLNGTIEVNFAAVQYNAEIDAGFPVGSADVE